MSDKKGLPPWVWIGCGCVGAIGAIVVVIAGLGFWGARKALEISETMNDPAARTDKALEVLGADALPEGYFTVAAFSVPYVFDLVMLSDQPPDEQGAPSQSARRGFMFSSFPSFGDGDEELYDFFEGRSDRLDSLKREQFDLDLKERIAFGRLERADDDILWVTHRGALASETIENPHDGLVTMVLVECNDDRRRIGIWFGPDPSPLDPVDSIDVSGTVADVSEMEIFLRPIAPCN